MSAVDEFVIVVVTNEAASSPARFCTALFEVRLDEAGALYFSVTVCPIPTFGSRVRTTVEPLTATFVTVAGEPLTITSNAEPRAVVDASAFE